MSGPKIAKSHLIHSRNGLLKNQFFKSQTKTNRFKSNVTLPRSQQVQSYDSKDQMDYGTHVPIYQNPSLKLNGTTKSMIENY